MTLKLAQFCDDPNKISTKSSYPQKLSIFLKTPKNIEILNFEPQKMGRAYVYVKILEYPPPPPPPPTLLVEVQIISVIQFHSLKLTYCFFFL